MRIFIDNFCLAAGGGESPTGLSVNGNQPAQVTRAFGAPTVTVWAKGGRINAVSFSVTREHPSHGAAESFLLAHAATLPASGDVTFLCEDAEGGPQIQYIAPGAAVTADDGTQNGANTTHKYTLVCGAITGGEVG